MEIRFAKIISVIFHPLLVPAYSYLILLNLKAYFSMIIPEQARWRIIALIFITTFILPSLVSFYLYKRKIISSMQMEMKEERTLPYMVTAIFFYLTYYMLNRFEISPVFYYYMAGATFLVIVTLIINLFWKISGHMISVGAVVGAIISLSVLLRLNLNALILISIFLAGLIAFARLRLGAHTPAQIYAGFFLGSIVMAGVFLLL
jgi:membrane-associated phospholipid phosphatase